MRWGIGLALALACPALGHTTDGKAFLARAAWSAFECSVLAAAKGEAADSERLTAYGIKAGNEFLSAHGKGEISSKEVNEIVPVGFLWSATGPSTDFIMGRVYESAVSGAWEKLYKIEGDVIPDDELRKARAETAYGSQNCVLVGR